MAKKNKKEEPLTITLPNSGKSYKVDALSDENKMLVNHAMDTTNKINNLEFQKEQILYGHNAVMKKLEENLEGGGETDAEIVQEE